MVRASFLAQNLTEGDIFPTVDEGVPALPVGPVPEPSVDCDDIADVVVAALLEDHIGKVYEVTGPQALTIAELAATYSRSTRRLVHAELSLEEAITGWRTAGLGEDAVWLLSAHLSTLFDGRNTAPQHGVERALGRPARDVTHHFATATSEAGTR